MRRLHSICGAKDCTNLAPPGQSRCPAHTTSKWTQYQGPDYGPDWPKIRAQVLAEEPRCRLCPAPATDVDHITPLAQGGTHARSNLRALCSPCHRHLTATMAKRRAS